MAGQPEPRKPLALTPLHIAGFGIIMLAVVFGAFGLQDGMRSYTTRVAEATTGQQVQLAGFLGSTGAYDDVGRWTFLLEDEEGATVLILSDEPRPANFEHATSIVAIGQYDAQQQAFVADDLLVKCPSKYQEQAATS